MKKYLILLIISFLLGCSSTKIETGFWRYEGQVIDIYYESGGLTCIETPSSLFYIKERVYLKDWAQWLVAINYREHLIKLENHESQETPPHIYSLIAYESKLGK